MNQLSLAFVPAGHNMLSSNFETIESKQKHDSVSNMPVVDRSVASKPVKPNTGSMAERKKKSKLYKYINIY